VNSPTLIVLASLAGLALACSGSDSDGTSGSGGNPADAGTDVPDEVAAADAPSDVAVDAGDDVVMVDVDPSVDGLVDEWASVPPVASDAAGDAVGPYDVTDVWAAGRGSALYLRTGVAPEPVNVLNGPNGETSLQVHVGLPDQRSLVVDLRAHTVYVDGTQQLGWSDVGFQVAPTTATTEMEIGFDLAGLGVVQGDVVTVDFGGSDALDEPISVGMGDPMEPEVGDPARAADTAFRVASLNVWWDGLVEPGQSEPIGRLIAAAAADVYCLQEVFDTNAAGIAQRLAEIDPHGDGAAWNVHRTGDTAIATRETLEPWPHASGAPPYTGAGITFGDGSRLVVFTLRPTCCGYIGDSSDLLRVSEFESLAAAIETLRAGTEPAFEAFADAPLVVMGDWNLVGSNTPVEIMTDPAGPALERWLIRHLVGDGAIYTWRSSKVGGFPPGTLDLLAHGGVAGGTQIEPLHGYVLDTGELDATMLAALGLQAQDSEASDHLLLVADFGM